MKQLYELVEGTLSFSLTHYEWVRPPSVYDSIPVCDITTFDPVTEKDREDCKERLAAYEKGSKCRESKERWEWLSIPKYAMFTPLFEQGFLVSGPLCQREAYFPTIGDPRKIALELAVNQLLWRESGQKRYCNSALHSLEVRCRLRKDIETLFPTLETIKQRTKLKVVV